MKTNTNGILSLICIAALCTCVGLTYTVVRTSDQLHNTMERLAETQTLGEDTALSKVRDFVRSGHCGFRHGSIRDIPNY